ncbi:MAG: ribonuclease III [Actinomycetes bacterium]
MPLTTSFPDSEAGPEPSDAAADVRAELCGRLGYAFADPGLLDLALRHRSWCAEHGGVPSNERLEFLGDSVLGLVVTSRLYRDDPETSEGVLARRRSELVSAVALAGVGRQIGLGGAVALGKGEETTGGRAKTSILSDALEAVIGAVYLDGGMDAATEVVLRLFEERIDVVTSGGPGSDHKSRLQELAAQEFGELPRYELSEEGPEHMKTFRAVVVVAGEARGAGEGRTKKEAEQAAALEACAELSGAPAAAPGQQDTADHDTRGGAATGTGGNHG